MWYGTAKINFFLNEMRTWYILEKQKLKSSTLVLPKLWDSWWVWNGQICSWQDKYTESYESWNEDTCAHLFMNKWMCLGSYQRPDERSSSNERGTQEMLKAVPHHSKKKLSLLKLSLQLTSLGSTCYWSLRGREMEKGAIQSLRLCCCQILGVGLAAVYLTLPPGTDVSARLPKP